MPNNFERRKNAVQSNESKKFQNHWTKKMIFKNGIITTEVSQKVFLYEWSCDKVIR